MLPFEAFTLAALAVSVLVGVLPATTTVVAESSEPTGTCTLTVVAVAVMTVVVGVASPVPCGSTAAPPVVEAGSMTCVTAWPVVYVTRLLIVIV